MKTLKSFLALGVLAVATSQVTAQLPSQPYVIPAAGDYGAFSVQEQGLGLSDPALAKAYDNFTLGAAWNITGIDFTGVYAEALPAALSDTDFVIEIWNDASGTVDTSAAVATFVLEGGPAAGTGGADLTVTQLAHVSPATASAVGGGEAFHYEGIVATTTLGPGNYWISIIADQTFGNVHPIVDPEWMWHLGTGPGDGFSAYDRLFDDPTDPISGTLQADKDLAFALKGSLVPEPSSIMLGLFGFAALGLLRRRK